MRVTITPPTALNASGTVFLLGDDTKAGISGASFPNGAGGVFVKDGGFVPNLTYATQRDELIDSAYVQELPRGNGQTEWTFSVCRTLDTQDNTLAFLADHPATVPITGTLAVYIGTTPTVRYLQNAVLTGVRCTEQSGTNFTFQYLYKGSYLAPVYGGAGTGTGGTFTPSAT